MFKNKHAREYDKKSSSMVGWEVQEVKSGKYKATM